MARREDLYRLIDELPEPELPTVRRFLEYLRDTGGDPVLRALARAPEDDERLTREDLDAIREADEAVARGEVIPHDEVGRQLGL